MSRDLRGTFLDRVFQNPMPDYQVNPSLIRLFQDAVIGKATADGWDEERMAGYMVSMDNYYDFLQELDGVLKGEIEHVALQIKE